MSALVFFWGPYLYHLYVLTKYGVSIAFTAPYWTLAAIAIFFTLVTIKYIRHPFGLVGASAMEFLYGALSFSLWIPEIVWWKNRTMAVGAMFWGFSCILGFILGMYLIKRRKRYVLDWAFSWKKLEALALVLLSLISFFWWAYGGFSMRLQMVDSNLQHPPYFKVSFWGFPSGGLNNDSYNTPAGEAELAAYEALNTTFYIGVTPTILNTTATRANLTSIIKKWDQFNLHAVINIQPSGSDGVPDTVGYYNLDITENLTLDVLKWRQDNALWNIEGMCFDAETPRMGRGVPDYVAYYKGVTQMTVIISTIQANDTALKVTVFAPASRAWDLVIDNDPDLDFLEMTVTHPPTNWDRYGFKTYRSGPKNLTAYWTYMHQQFIAKTYGATKSVPIIGHAGEKNFVLEGSDQDGVGFQELMSDLLVCKYLGVSEAIIDSASSFTNNTMGQNGSARLTWIYDFLATKPSLDIPISNDRAYFDNFINYILMFNFDNIYVDVDLFRDLAVTIGDIFTFLYVPLFFYFLYKGLREKRTPRKPRPSLVERIRQRRSGERSIG